jgi:hypothetical protein
MRVPATTLASLTMLLPAAAAKGQESAAMPIQVAANPQWELAGAKFTIRGSTVVDGMRKQVRIQIRPPLGSLLELSAPVSSAGEYAATTGPLRALGTYRVLATAPDGRGTDTTSFRVLSFEEAYEEALSEWPETVEGADRAVKKTEELVKAMPVSPPRAEVEAKLQQARQELARRKQAAADFRRVVESIRTAHGKALAQRAAPPPAAFEDYARKLGTWASESREAREELNRQLQESGQRGSVCESMNAAGEGIKVASGFLNLAGSAVGVTLGFFKDFLADQAGQRIPDPGYSLATQEMVKVGPTLLQSIEQMYGSGLGPLSSPDDEIRSTAVKAAGEGRASAAAGALGVIPGILYDVAGYFVNKLFEKYCETFAGPISGTIHVEFLSEAGDPWWIYDIDIEGKLELRYARADAAQAVKVHGELYGSGRRFTLWERTLYHLDKKLMTGTLTYRKYWMPGGAPFVELEGRYFGSMLPRAFFVPVEGELVDSTLTLRILEAKTDFKDVAAQGIYVITSQKTMGFPVVIVVPFPYTGARSMVRKALDAEEGPAKLRVKVDRRAKTLRLDSTAVRKRVRGDGYVYDATLSIRACNPGCGG